MKLRDLATKRWLLWFVAFVYVTLLLEVVLFKKPYALEIMFGSGERLPLSIRLKDLSNFTPFKTIVYYLGGSPSPGIALRNLVGNLVAFMPMGFLLPVILPKLRSLTHIAIVSLVLSLSFEVAQLITGLGEFDVDDLLLNVLGATIGFLIYRVLKE